MTTAKKFYYYAFALMGTILILFSSCEKEDVPIVTTTEVTEISQTTATSGGDITDDGGATVTARGVCWSTSQNPDISDRKTQDGTDVGIFSSSITGIEPSKTYYVRAYATNSAGTGYGRAMSFTTHEEINLPTLTTSEVTEISQTTAKSGGNITNDGGATITIRGVCWSTNQTPTISDSKTEDGTSLGSFTSSIISIEPSKTYYVRAYATNSAGTGYGSAMSFTTLEAIVPTLSTVDVTEITQTNAKSGGNITDDGGVTVTAYGVCWSTSQNPTISDNKTEDGSGTGFFTSSIIGLEPSKTYYIRSYATNSKGTGYGVEKSFSTYNSNAITDIDGNYYNIVTIGTQEWMAENLKTTKYNNGIDIPNYTGNSAWAGLSSGAYCWYNNDQVTYENTYGALYNWYAVETGTLCPTGWRVPTDVELTVLTDYVGGAYIAGAKLKATSGWYDGGNGTDEYVFSALPGGYRYWYDGSFISAGKSGRWWSSTETNEKYPWYRSMYYEAGNVYRSNLSKGYGFSVRCLRDN